MKNRTIKNGYTLLEALVALTLSGVILTLLNQTFASVFTSQNRAAIQTNDRILANVNRLKRFLSGVVDPASSHDLRFQVETDPLSSLTCVIDSGFDPTRGVPGGLSRITIQKTAQSDVELIVRPLDADRAEMRTMRIFRNVGEFKIECLDRDGAWIETWDSLKTASLPNVVKITTRFAEVVEMDVLETIVPIRRNGGVHE